MAAMRANQISMPTFYEHYARAVKAGGNIFTVMDSLEVPREKIGSVNVKLADLRKWFKEKFKQELPALARRPRTTKEGSTVSPVKDQLAKLGNLFAQNLDDDEGDGSDGTSSTDVNPLDTAALAEQLHDAHEVIEEMAATASSALTKAEMALNASKS